MVLNGKIFSISKNFNCTPNTARSISQILGTMKPSGSNIILAAKLNNIGILQGIYADIASINKRYKSRDSRVSAV